MIGFISQLLQSFVMTLALELAQKTAKALASVAPSVALAVMPEFSERAAALLGQKIRVVGVESTETTEITRALAASLAETTWLAVLVAMVCGISWWTVTRIHGPAAPHEVSRYRKLWWLLAGLYGISVIGYFATAMAEFSDFQVQGLVTVLPVWLVLGIFIFYLPSLFFSPPTVIGTVPGGGYMVVLLGRIGRRR